MMQETDSGVSILYSYKSNQNKQVTKCVHTNTVTIPQLLPLDFIS
jgi:hypothetical protein